MSILTFILLVLGGLLLLGLGTAAFLVFIGKRMFLSWKEPYKRATESLMRLSGPSLSFLQEFSQQPSLYQWVRNEANREPAALYALFCAADDSAKDRIFASLTKPEQKRLRTALKRKKKFSQQELDDAKYTVRRYMEKEYQNPLRKSSLSFYKLYFYEEYGQALQHIEHYKKAVNPVMQEAITDIAASVLSSIPYYKERRMYEQQHKFEVFLTKDLPDMLTLISNLPPAQRKEKEQELTVYLQEFQEEINSSHAALEQELNVKMRAAKEKFHAN